MYVAEARGPDAVPMLLEALRDPSWKVELAAIEGLRGFPEPETTIPLLEYCYDGRKELAEAALVTLGLPGPPSRLTRETLTDLYERGNLRTRLAVLNIADRHFREDAVTTVYVMAARDGELDPALRRAALECLAESEISVAAPILLEAARGGDREARLLALKGLRTLCRRSREAPVPAEELRGLCSDEDPGVARAAVETVGAIGGLAASEIVKEAMHSNHAPVRLGAYNALLSFDRPGYADALWRAADDPSELVRLGVAEGLPANAPSEAASAVATLLRDETPNVRFAAVAALARCGRVDALGLVAECVGSPDEDLAGIAFDLISGLGGAEAVARVVLGSTFESPYDRARALLRLQGIEDFDAERYLRSAQAAGDSVTSAQETLEAISEMRSLLRAAGAKGISEAESRELLRRAGPAAHEKRELLRARLPDWVRSDRELIAAEAEMETGWGDRIRRFFRGE